MDGVLAEVSKSYRAAIEKTCHTYGATSVTQETITEWKIRGNANDDWRLSHALILDDPDSQKDVTLEQVTETFEKFYQGDGTTKGLYTLETLIPDLATIKMLNERSKPGIGIVTGRPRSDCLKFLKDFNLEDYIAVSYCMEDGPSKPDPFPVLKACELLGVSPGPDVVLVGDTPDDIKAAVSAGCSCVGVITPEALVACEDKTRFDTTSPLCVAMRENGADLVLLPGFADLVNHFCDDIV
jgi:HAD superfamily hydrolase (TIGR01548 family)